MDIRWTCVRVDRSSSLCGCLFWMFYQCRLGEIMGINLHVLVPHRLLLCSLLWTRFLVHHYQRFEVRDFLYFLFSFLFLKFHEIPLLVCWFCKTFSKYFIFLSKIFFLWIYWNQSLYVYCTRRGKIVYIGISPHPAQAGTIWVGWYKKISSFSTIKHVQCVLTYFGMVQYISVSFQ